MTAPIQPIDRTVNFFEVAANEPARRMIENNDWTDNQIVQLQICEEHDRERHHASEKGECSPGCNENNLIDLNGRSVCKWTRKECPRRNLSLIVERYERLNRRKLDV